MPFQSRSIRRWSRARRHRCAEVVTDPLAVAVRRPARGEVGVEGVLGDVGVLIPARRDPCHWHRTYGRGHAERYTGGTKGRGGIDRHGAAPEMVIPGHIPGVVHEEGTELSARERDVAGLNGARTGLWAGDIPRGVVV